MTTGAWRVLPLSTGRPAELLAEGVELFERLADDPTPTLRWYLSTAAAVVLGRGQRDQPVHPAGVDVVTRHSGGGAVWLSPDVLSLDVLVPAHHPWVGDVPTDAFDHVGHAWLAGLTTLGIGELTVHTGPATARRRGTERERLLAAVCYATRGRGEVFWRDRKLVGLAQRRRRHGAVVQCGLLRRWQPQPLLIALGADAHDAEIATAAVGLTDIGSAPPSDGDVIAAATAAFTRAADRRIDASAR